MVTNPPIEAETVQPTLERAQRVLLVVAVVGVVLSLIGLVVDRSQFFQSYLAAYLWVLGLTLGTLGVSIIHYLAGGRWGAAVGDVVRSGASLVWLMPILFIPIIIGIPVLYPWANPATVAADPLLQHKAGWYTIPFWLIRAAIYFASWFLVSRYLDRWFRHWDKTGNPRFRWMLRNLAGGGVVLVVMTVSFAMFDWVMSLQPDWDSSIYGLLLVAGFTLSGWAITIQTLSRLRHWWPVSGFAAGQMWVDISSLMLANLIVWMYFSFSQFMLVWVENLNDEIPYFIPRVTNGWGAVALAVLLIQFAATFLTLIQRGTRKSAVALQVVTVSLLVWRFVEMVWYVEPTFPPSSIVYHWQDLALLLALGGIWGTLFVRQLRARLVVLREVAIYPEHELSRPAPGATHVPGAAT
jgi:hypothetical protein